MTLKENFLMTFKGHYSDLKLKILSGLDTDPFGPSPLVILSIFSIASNTFPKAYIVYPDEVRHKTNKKLTIGTIRIRRSAHR